MLMCLLNWEISQKNKELLGRGMDEKGKKLAVWSLKKKEKGMPGEKDGFDSLKMGNKSTTGWLHVYVRSCGSILT